MINFMKLTYLNTGYEEAVARDGNYVYIIREYAYSPYFWRFDPLDKNHYGTE